MGIKGVRVEDPQELRGAVREVLAHDGPALLDVVSARQELVDAAQGDARPGHHFSLFMVKAVMDGRAGQLIDLARTNLRI